MSAVFPRGDIKIVHYLAKEGDVTLCGLQIKPSGGGPSWMTQENKQSKKVVDCPSCISMFKIFNSQKPVS